MASAIGKCAGNADRTEGIQSVSILHAFPLRRGRPDGIRPLEGYLVNDLTYLPDFRFRHVLTAHKPDGIFFLLGGHRGKLPVVYIMQQRRQCHDRHVGMFHLRDVYCGSVNTHGMKKVVSAEIVLENLFDEFCRVLDELFHNFISCLAQQILFNGLILSHNAPKYKNSRSE